MQSSVGPFNAYPVSGDVLDGKYRVERLLGEGGMGAVAKATHLLRRAPVALKFMSPAMLAFPEAVERFVNEGVAASQIDSDHVVKVFDVGRLPSGAPYLVMNISTGTTSVNCLRSRARASLRCAPSTSPCRVSVRSRLHTTPASSTGT